MTTTEYNMHVNALGLNNGAVAQALRVNYTTPWRWRTGRVAIPGVTAYVLREYFETVRESLEADNFTGVTK
jgi:hypothetical protein